MVTPNVNNITLDLPPWQMKVYFGIPEPKNDKKMHLR